MTFSIRLLLESVNDLKSSERACWGMIMIGSFQERFLVPLDYWTASDYEGHWKQAATRILQSSTSSCMVTSMYDPATANFIIWWPMYRVGDTVFIQNQILFLDSLSSPFNPNDPFSSIPERRTINEDGEEISEWSVLVKDLESFLQEGP